MATRPLNPTGGDASIIKARMPDNEIRRLDRAVKRRGIDRSQFIREALAQVLDAEEVSASAS
jgi:metal-responsive CopG/Arc/MetJ family transcriptional regulator